MQEIWVWPLSQEDPLEEEMATHSSILAWEIPWTEELGGLQSMGLQRARHDGSTAQHKSNTVLQWINLQATPPLKQSYDQCGKSTVATTGSDEAPVEALNQGLWDVILTISLVKHLSIKSKKELGPRASPRVPVTFKLKFLKNWYNPNRTFLLDCEFLSF